MEESYLSAFNSQHYTKEFEFELELCKTSADHKVPKFRVESKPNVCQTSSADDVVVCTDRKLSNEDANYKFFFKVNKMKGRKGKTTKKLIKKRRPRGNYPTPNSPSLLPSSPRELKLHCSKEREQQTPPLQPSLKLMEKHRENERVRHQTLNELMKKLRCQIPGNEEYSKGTKVVTMQRAVCYIVYLEKMITKVCTELDLNLDDYRIFLTSKLSHDDLRKTLWGQNGNDFESDTYQCRKFPTLTQSTPQKFTRKNPTKMCSTMLNTTDNPVTPLKEDSLSEVEHFPGLSLSDESYLADPFSCYFKSKSPASGGFNSIFDNSSSLQSFDTNDEASILKYSYSTEDPSSDLTDFTPIYKPAYPSLLNGDPMFHQVMDCPRIMCAMNIKYEVNVETAEELQCVSPDEISPVGFTNFHSNVPAPQELNNKPCQMVSEMSIKKENVSPSKPSLQRPLRGVVGRKGDDQYESYCWKFHEIANIRRQKADMATVKEEVHFDHIDEKMEKVVQRKIRDEKLKNPLKVDHRRASWMNGFMMYSQINRRTFISANPGVHTSHISKMMGHAWRCMPADKQLPYKEKAKKCAQYLQDALMMKLPGDNGISDKKTTEDKAETLTTADIPNGTFGEFTIKLE